MTVTYQDRVDDSILDFCSLIEQVWFGTFDLKLPSTFSAPKERDPIKLHNNDDKFQGKQDVGNKLPGGKKEQSKRVISTAPCKEFKLEKSETWRNNFASKKITKQ